MNMTAKFLIMGGFQHSDPALTQQIQRINQACPGLFDRLLPQADRTRIERLALQDGADDIEVPDADLANAYHINDEPGHTSVKARMKLQQHFVRDTLHLPTRGNGEHMQSVKNKITTAFDEELNRPNVTFFVRVPMKWWKEISFDDK